MVYYDPSGYEQCKSKTTGNVTQQVVNEGNNHSYISRAGDADFVGPIQDGSWKLVPNGDGAHLVERSNVRGRKDLSIYDQESTPRYYPKGTPESAGQAHIRLHETTRNKGIKLRGGNSGLSDQELLDSYACAYSNFNISGIKGDLRTPDASKIIATDVSPSEAYKALIDWGNQQRDN